MAKQYSVNELFRAALDLPRTTRSPEYKAGVLAALKFRVEGKKIRLPYRAGTAQADAFFAGCDEGHAIWRRHTSVLQQAEEKAMLTAFNKMPIADQVSIYGLIHDRAAANKCGTTANEKGTANG